MNEKLDLQSSPDRDAEVPLEATQKSRWQRIWPAMACGAGLFSDGYLQAVIGPVNTILSKLYPVSYAQSSAAQNVSSIAFAGTVVGQLVFGYTSDHYSRKWSLLVSTVILFVFAALGAGAYGANGSPQGLFAALTAFRFLLGIGIGGEYPAGSVACAEATGELKEGSRNRWFCLFTNTQIDLGFVIGTLIPMIITAARPDDLGLVWRLSLGLGVIPPLSLLYLRLKLKEPESVSREAFRHGKTPYWLAIKYYWPRLVLVMMIWSATLRTCPGAILGSFTSDWLGPKRALMIFVAAQGVLGFIMSGCYEWLQQPKYIGAFVVVYGVFLMLGEMGPGDNIGLVASKTCATGIRGQYYAIAAATGKVGGLVGGYVFPIIQADGGGATLHGGQYPFYVASALCFFSAFLVFWLPNINQDTIQTEDIRFREYLVANGYDISNMGNSEWQEKRKESVMGGHGGVMQRE
ncbi:glycerophosphoinositol permease [Friedmanniomyces endolithicus]|uniref:Glycerophosphoinositol permease n=1 Tax=Friedmanniomyces endolithicus TaxID=329885 RepID=A0AAN6KKC5_9PEZI|nr:glycerophosphoinositol permease [Friedmanniomyces endolithicus]KAK0987181.1 glycerophosphoinositol permease [Friedmanniomyces endolithicus]KAK1062821.1 glycerophosphoinositol permease [Friedmanniomyces endolithicus]